MGHPIAESLSTLLEYIKKYESEHENFEILSIEYNFLRPNAHWGVHLSSETWDALGMQGHVEKNYTEKFDRYYCFDGNVEFFALKYRGKEV